MMKKKEICAIAALAAMIAAASCAKEEKKANYESARRYVEAWMHVNYPGIEANGEGVYILDETVGTGAEIADSDYLFVDYTITTLDGTISSTNDPQLAKQIGTYSKSDYYGRRIWFMGEGSSQYAGLEKALLGMREGGSRRVVVPRWFITSSRFDSIEGYIGSNKGGSEDYIYSFTVHDALDSLERWQIDTIDRYIDRVYGKGRVTESSRGFRYIRLKEPSDTKDFPRDTTIRINYTGRLLNGQVFDTTIEDTAKVHNIYSASRSYEPVSVSWSDSYAGIQLSGSSTIAGFAMTLWQMKACESGVGIFYSNYGYSSSGSGGAIPEYAPLVFEIEIVAKSDDE